MWLPWALLSAVAAALTAILAKIGVAGVPSTTATAIRTAVVLVLAWGLWSYQGPGPATDGGEPRVVMLRKGAGLTEIASTLAEGGYAVLVDSPAAAIEVANMVAPEHLELLCADPESLVPAVRNAGAIFCGPWSPASVGDYLAGPSHVLPTYGTARFASALTVDDFLKHHHVITVDRSVYDEGGRIADAVTVLAEAEGLEAHAESIRLRRRLLGIDAAAAASVAGSAD